MINFHSFDIIWIGRREWREKGKIERDHTSICKPNSTVTRHPNNRFTKVFIVCRAMQFELLQTLVYIMPSSYSTTKIKESKEFLNLQLISNETR